MESPYNETEETTQEVGSFEIDIDFLLLCSQFAEARRNQLLEQGTRDRKQQYNQNIAEWKKRYLDKENESKRKCHEDGIKHLQVRCHGDEQP